MLYIAQRVHQLLLDQDTESMDKSLMGSIILAGDFCFSRAADLAVRTENPGIVAVFSTALKRLSEDNLREIFDKNERDAYSDMELLASGIEAALLLAGTAPSAGHSPEDGARRWANNFLSGAANAVSDESLSLNTHQQQRIRQLLTPN
jgi:geranylgeranyl pyrophosphate synthase